MLSAQVRSMPSCWICGAVADTREHKTPASVLRKLYATDWQQPSTWPFHFVTGGHSQLRGAKSNSMKYPKSLCNLCNNSRSQPSDAALLKVFEWSQSDHHIGLSHVAAKDIFGDVGQGINVPFLRSCVKSLGCRIVNAGFDLPPSFPNPLNAIEISPLQVSLCWNTPFPQLLELSTAQLTRILGKGALLFQDSTGNETRIRPSIRILWCEWIGLLQITYWYEVSPDPIFGQPIGPNDQIINFASPRAGSAEILNHFQSLLNQ